MGMTTTKTLPQLVSTDEDTQAVAPAHELGCIEIALELIVESAAANGIRFAGDITEVHEGRTLADLARERVTEDCHCN